MTKNGKWRMHSALAGFALTLTLVGPMVRAQAPATPAPAAPAPGGPGQGRGPGGGFGRGMQNQTVDPSHSALMTLLRRNDVKTEIMLSQRQIEDMTAEATKQQDELQQKVQAARIDRATLQNLPQDERRAKQQEARQKQQEIRQAGQIAMDEDLNKKATEVLKPEQLKRLKELDLQWRGPLALGDPKVAESYKLTDDQKTKIAAILADYRKTQQDTMRAVFPNGGGRRGNGNNGQPADPNATPPAAPDPAELQKKMDEAKVTVDKAREEGGAKVVALLTDEQKAQWTAALGKKFAFRQHDS